MTEKQPVGKVGKEDAVEAAKTGAIVEVLLESVRPSLEVAAERTTNQYLDTIEALPPGSGLAIGFGIRIGIALIEERGSVLATGRATYRWVKKKMGGGK